MIPLLALAALSSTGTYFEARTCSVFAGPCHYSGEVTVDGRTAVVIWKFEAGPFAGTEAAALIEADQNLVGSGRRTTRIFVDGAGNQQSVVGLLRTRLDLGTITAVSRAKIDLLLRRVEISGIYSAVLSDERCSACTMPGQLWYSPLDSRAAATPKTVDFHQLVGAWSRRDEAAAFVGRF
jgi:hypothetical protein